MQFTDLYKSKLNNDIKNYTEVTPINSEMNQTFEGISQLIMLDRYSYKDPKNKTLTIGDLVVLTIKADPQYPTRGLGYVDNITDNHLTISVDVEYRSALTSPTEISTGKVVRDTAEVEKPLELYFEQIASRVSRGVASVEKENKQIYIDEFYKYLSNQDLIPAGRVLYGAGTNTQVTYFNCFVMPFIEDSRGGISKHRQEVMEIMSRGGGVGTNGSTLRPRSSVVHGVNGKSSGAISWLNDLASLTHLVEQGGSRRGAQMIMLNDWHPDIFEFIISKIQNPITLQNLSKTSTSEIVRRLADEKLNFTPLSVEERKWLEYVVDNKSGLEVTNQEFISEANQKLKVGGVYTVKDPNFLTGANISVCLTKEFMKAVEEDSTYELRFPAIERYNADEMNDYNKNWKNSGDVREWEKTGHEVRVYQTIKARELWDLITYCATYSAEPGIFFIDNANDMTNASAYGQKIVATNPCGEQPLTPYAVCNLAAINLANVADKELKTVNFEKLESIVKASVRFQDNVIDATPYFLDKNEKQAKGERRVGLGVMGLADLLIYCEKRYGSVEGNKLVDEVFERIAVTAYRTSIEIAKEKGSFPFLVGKTEDETLELRRKFINSGYMKKMPEELRKDVLEHGIRNSHLLTVAPTGSTGTMAGVSTGLEPYFSFSYFRSGRLGKFIEVNAEIVEEYLQKNSTQTDKLPNFFVSAMELSPEDHVSTQCTIQRWVDSSISKTVNAPRGYTVSKVASIYEDLYRGGAKGGTVYVDGSRESQVLTLAVDEGIVNTPVILDTEDSEYILSKDLSSENCPICEIGTIEEIGGCSTCTNCKIQLKCGL